ncbi:hypothetical protein AAFF_G00043740 [Aldrovandia affinis]|uniref:Uncharacterized protein n=1 Tax=Aldrovandia affinis TaxID=143900 RepID=A0AAD7WEX0_9TELE|nr:hypothetical protein AAFF_G00043740 [Aldrovandia affinis]
MPILDTPANSIMRRSAAPSQQFGNVAKRPRFVPPGASQSASPDSRPQPTSQPPQLAACKTLQVLKCLPEQKSEAPILSKALARILNATPPAESKENCTALQNPSSLPCSEEWAPEDGSSTELMLVSVEQLQSALQYTSPNSSFEVDYG